MSNPEITQTKGEYCSVCESCLVCVGCGVAVALLAGISGYGTVSLLA